MVGLVRVPRLTCTHEGYACQFSITKTDLAGQSRTMPVKGDAAAALTAWLDQRAAGITVITNVIDMLTG